MFGSRFRELKCFASGSKELKCDGSRSRKKNCLGFRDPGPKLGFNQYKTLSGCNKINIKYLVEKIISYISIQENLSFKNQYSVSY